jgi:hypothetical protein
LAESRLGREGFALCQLRTETWTGKLLPRKKLPVWVVFAFDRNDPRNAATVANGSVWPNVPRANPRAFSRNLWAMFE